MTDNKPLSQKPRKKKVIKKKRNRIQRFLRNMKKERTQKKEVSFGDKVNAHGMDKKKKIKILLVVLAVIMVGVAIVLGVLSHQKKIRRQEAWQIMQEARALRKQKEKTQKERYLQTVSERVRVADALQTAWEDLWLEEIELTAENQDIFATIESCLISEEDPSIVEIKGTLPGIPKSDSDDIYIPFEYI